MSVKWKRTFRPLVACDVCVVCSILIVLYCYCMRMVTEDASELSTYLGEFKLLFHVRHHSLTLEADECP